jgi:predicted CXXCH cytochrome family protein
VGADYREEALRFPHRYAPAEALAPEIRLFGGKIGCGTCHNGFSKEKGLLVIANQRSMLCMECHMR